MILYVKEEDVFITKKRKDFIRQFLRGKKIKSYNNPECTEIQCDGKGVDQSKSVAYRSITELHQLVKSRFPITSFNAVVKIIYEIIAEEESVILVWCNHIEKVVVKYEKNSSAKWISDYSKKNHYTKKGVDGYSLEDYDKIKENL